MAQYEVMGDSYADDCNCYTVTDDELNQVGAAWNLNSIDLNEDFDMQFEVFLGCTPGGADGLAFVMASEGGQLGNNGSAMGVGGLERRGILPCQPKSASNENCDL